MKHPSTQNSLLICFCCLLSFFSSLHAATYTVTHTGDSGSGSLREAINLCNITPGADQISFNITGMAPHVISPLSSLPSLNDPGTMIDGSTQPANGYTGTGRKIVIDGSNLSGGYGLELLGTNIVVKGLFIRYFPYAGVYVGSAASGYGLGVAGNGNTISGNLYYGIEIDGADQGSILGNFIGTNDSGMVALPNEYDGILITNNSNNNVIGNTSTGGGNVISGNMYYGIRIECSSNNTVKNNKIGVDVQGNGVIPNEYSGVHVSFESSINYTCPAQNNVIGGIGAGEGNIIANNLYYGVNICGSAAIYNPVRGNSIYCNDYDGLSLDDGNYGQPDGNNGYPAPTITSANASGATGVASPSDWIDLYFDDNCTNCEPRAYIATVQAGPSGSWTYSGALAGSVTAIATHSTNGNSSANSACFFISASATPIAGFNSNANQFCGSGCVNFNDQSTGSPTSWTWSFPGATPSSSTQQNPQNVCYSSPGTYNVSLTATNNFGSHTVSSTGYITVLAQPQASAGQDAAVCAGGSVQLSGSGGGGYTWSPSAGLSNPNVASPTATPSGTTTYILTAANGICTDQDTVVVTVNPLPVVAADTTLSLCAGDSVLISSTASTGATYQWSPTNGLSAPTSGTTYASPTGNIVYSCLVTDQNGCTATRDVTINVGTAATPTITSSGMTLSSSAGASYEWYFNGSPIIGATGQNHVALQSGTYSVYVTYANGCGAFSGPFQFEVLGIGSSMGLNFTLVPNPAQHLVSVQLSSDLLADADLQVLDLCGRTVRTMALPLGLGANASVVLDVAALPAGLYTVVLNAAEGRLAKVLVVER